MHHQPTLGFPVKPPIWVCFPHVVSELLSLYGRTLNHDSMLSIRTFSSSRTVIFVASLHHPLLLHSGTSINCPTNHPSYQDDVSRPAAEEKRYPQCPPAVSRQGQGARHRAIGSIAFFHGQWLVEESTPAQQHPSWSHLYQPTPWKHQALLHLPKWQEFVLQIPCLMTPTKPTY